MRKIWIESDEEWLKLKTAETDVDTDSDRRYFGIDESDFIEPTSFPCLLIISHDVYGDPCDNDFILYKPSKPQTTEALDLRPKRGTKPMTTTDHNEGDLFALMDTAEAFLDYLETHDELDEVELTDLHHATTKALGKLLGWDNIPVELDPAGVELAERVRRETEEYLITSCEFKAFIDETEQAQMEGVSP